MQIFEATIGYTFTDPALLRKALFHPSALPPGEGLDFERFEFLGDRVLGLVVASWLLEKYPKADEGELAKRFIGLVRKEALLAIAGDISLEKAMKIKHEQSTSQQKRLETLLADGCEALIGAIYLDGGFASAQSFIYSHWESLLHNCPEPPQSPKSRLQEWAQGQGKKHPIYTVVESSGPAHSPLFIVEVSVEGLETAQGEGSSKRLAEAEAAQNLLNLIFSHD